MSLTQVVKKDFKPGNIVFFDFSGKQAKTERVGIVVSVGSGYVYTIEGNTGAGNDANGGAAQKRKRSLDLITVGVRPNYPD